MYVEAYNLIREMLEDSELKAFVKELTGKNLTVIDSGPQVTTPCARIALGASTVGQIRNKNTAYDADYTITFEMPFWKSDGMLKAHLFLDKAIQIFMEYKSADGGCAIKRATPVLVEVDPERKLWTVAISVTVFIFA